MGESRSLVDVTRPSAGSKDGKLEGLSGKMTQVTKAETDTTRKDNHEKHCSRQMSMYGRRETKRVSVVRGPFKICTGGARKNAWDATGTQSR